MNRKAALGFAFVFSLIAVFLVLNGFITAAEALEGKQDLPVPLIDIADDGSRHFEPEMDQGDSENTIPIGDQWSQAEVAETAEPEYLTIADLQPDEPSEEQRARWRYLSQAEAGQRRYVSRPRSDVKNTYAPGSQDGFENAVFGRTDGELKPNNINAAYSITLETVHLNSSGNGFSSAFVFTNTGGAVADYYVDYYWPNGSFETQSGPYNLGVGASQHIDMDADNPTGRDYFVGWVVVSGDEPVSGEITTPEYAYFSGMVYQTDATTPIANVWIDVQSSSSRDYFGGNNSIGDGSFYVGGLPGGEYIFTAHPSYPWAKQWYNQQPDDPSANPVSISAGDHITGIDFVLDPGGIISGYVFSENGITPLENVNVDLNQGNYGTCTDSSGYYQIEAVPYGDNYIVAGRDWNWCTQENSIYILEYYSETMNFDDATPININSGNDIVGEINFTLDVGGIITGRVTAEVGGVPLENVQVSASEYDQETFWSNAWTDSDGYYTIGGLVDGDYRVRIDNPDGGVPDGFAGEFYNDTYNYNDADRVTISGGSAISDINFALAPGGTMTGIVIDLVSGLPVSNVNIDVHNDSQGFGMGNCTDSNGFFQVNGLPYGEYVAQAGGVWNHCINQPGEYASQFYDHKTAYHEADLISLNESFTTVTDINFSLEKGSYIRGTVVDESQGNAPVVDLRIEAQVPNGDCPWCAETVAETRTDSNGEYVLGPLVEGEYALYACTDCDDILLVNEYYNDAYNLENADLISVTGGVTVTGVNLYLGPGIFITGTVTVPGGYSQAGIQIDVNCWDGLDWGTGRQTDENGNYIVPVPPSYDSRWEVAVRPWETDLGFQWATEFDLAQHTNWDFDLGPGGTITGRVTNDGSPLVGVNAFADSDWMHNNAETDDQGYFEITNLPPGEYIVGADGEWMGYKNTYYGGHEWDWAITFYLDEGEIIGNANFEMPELGRLEGHVFASDGFTPLEGVEVTAMNNDGFWMGRSQFDGYFQIDLPAGKHKIRFGMEDWSMEPVYYPDSVTFRDALTVTVPPVDDSLYISETLENWATLSGQITDADTGDPIGGIHVGVMNVDNWSADGTCTDENGEYHISQFWHGGDVIVTAVGTCGAYEYETVTTTFATDPGVDYTWNVSMTAGAVPELPFTIKTNHIFGLSPQTSSGTRVLNENDQLLPALFTPIAQLNADGEWFSELLTQIPTLDNGGVSINNDQVVMTYTLKSDLFWSDGAELTSADIRFAWEMYTWPHYFNDPWQLNGSELGSVENISTPDALTAVLTFKPGYFSPSYPGTIPYPMPEHVLAGEHPMDILTTSEFNHFPVGNGPYKVADWVPLSHIDLVSNPNYHKRTNGYPKIEELRILFNGHPFWSLVSGEADVSLNADTNALPEDPESWDVVLYPSTRLGFDSIYLNHNTPFFSDANVRKALYYALDRGRFVENQGFNRVKAETWMAPEYSVFTDTFTHYDFNLSTAGQLLTDAGWTDSNGNGTRDQGGVEFEFDLFIPEGHEVRTDLTLMFQSDLESIGVNANIVETDWNSIIENGLKRGQLDAFTVGFILNNRYVPDGYSFFHSRSIPTAYNRYNDYNAAHWENTTNDSLLEAAKDELVLNTLKTIYAEQLALFNDEIPQLVHSHFGYLDAAVPTVVNFTPKGLSTPATWNIEEWEQPDNPYDLSVRKALALNSPAPQPDTTVTYEISIRNLGYFTVTGATLIDEVQSDLIYVGANPAPSQINWPILTWDLGDIPGNSEYGVIELSVHIPASYSHQMTIRNESEVYGDQTDTHPTNNGFVHVAEVREGVDLAINKSGVGHPAIGENFSYYLDYANWGGAPATNVVITDTLPPEVDLKNTTPAYSAMSGDTITWTLPTLAGNQWGGQIQINVEITESGTVTNVAGLSGDEVETTYDNNQDDHVDHVDEILAPVILRPTSGTVDQTPTVSGLAPSNSVVDLYEMTDPGNPTFIMSTTATVSGTFSMELNLAEGTYIFAATATKDGLTSDFSSLGSRPDQRINRITEGPTVDVDHDLPLDPDYVEISADDVDISAGSVRANRYTLSQRKLDTKVRLSCSVQPIAHLEITENGTNYYEIGPSKAANLGSNEWEIMFKFWLGEAHSTYDIYVAWTCNGEEKRENLMFVLIDPDGFVYDQTLVDAGSTITDSILVNGIVTAYVRTGDDWIVWPAYVYGQTNPQLTDGITDDGVIVAGYYSFLTPPGQYYIVATAPGYQPYQSEILTVIDTVIHLDIGLMPIAGGSGFNLAPVDLSSSGKNVDMEEAWQGDILSYDLHLVNSGDEDTGVLHLIDVIPTNTVYVGGSLGWSSGEAGYDPATDVITWTGMVTGGESVHISFQVWANGGEGTPYEVRNTAEVTSTDTNLVSLPELTASTKIQNQVGFRFDGGKSGKGGAGEVVTYQHLVTNTSNYTETFLFSSDSSQGWLIEIEPAEVMLGPGVTTTLQVSVTIPTGVAVGVTDTATITATSETYENYTEEVEDVTAVLVRTYIPILMR